MSINSTYRPDETNVEIFSEHTWLQGAFLASVAYGMQALLFFMSVGLLWKARKTHPKRNLGLLVYITALYTGSTIYMGALLQFTQLSFIDDRNIPGGPNEFEDVEFSLPVDMIANVLMVILTWMCDIINVWRCSVIYMGSRVPLFVVITIPCLMYLGSLVFGILFLKQVGSPSDSPWATSGVNWTVPYYSMSLALNILITILIVSRLLVTRSRINQALGKKHGSQYTSLAALVVESAAIYSTFSLLFLIPFAMNTPVSAALSQMWLQALSPVQVLSTILIIFRVAQGRSWTQHTVTVGDSTGGTSGATHTIGGSTRPRSHGLQIRSMGVHTTDSSIILKGMNTTIGTASEFAAEAKPEDAI
ncbi:hypothetical protein K438DRAFT_1804276 [Mycena galopus ATCC 62051]|nr:hypothetical protein K438DRAFT_1804276 [Mycena galopus ATCC 62051]